MKHRRFRLLAVLVVVLAAASPCVDAAAPTMPPTFEGLVRVASKNLDAVYLLPGADFGVYKKVLIDPVEVSFSREWMRGTSGSGTIRRRVDEKDAQQIADAMRSGFADIFAAAFAKTGYEVVTSAGPDVLRLSPGIVNLYISAPASATARTARTYTVDAGEATLALQARDSTTGALLGVAIDRRRTRSSDRLEVASSTANRAAFEDLFRQWARICTVGLEALKSRPAK
jgi:hypothetical protein